MNKIKFTIRWLNGLKPGTPAKFADTETRGFQVWVTKTSLNFYFVMKHKGKQFHQCVGRYPDMKLEEARADVLKRLGGLANFGKIDAPAARRQPTIGEAIDAFCESFQNEKTKRNYVGYLRTFANFRDRKISEVTHEEIVNFHAAMKEHPVMANHAVKALATAISRLYESLEITDYSNPARNVTLYKEYPRKRFLDEQEAPAIIQELEKMTAEPLYHVQAFALLMMIYTGQRKSNVLAMDYSEIWNNETWLVPRDKAKGGEDIAVPLNNFAKDILRKLCGKETFPKSGPVFVRRGVQLQNVRKTMDAVCRRCGIENLHIHDLRRSLGSWMLMNGVDIAVVSRTLGHKSIAVTEKVYAHLLPGKISTATQATISAMRQGKV